ncbi:MAG TPA: hypothetical protein VJG13_10130 [Thermoanaerobaculia bacterium]|nr:hypothetical protein [Thermoanaerobaculia bacterium]
MLSPRSSRPCRQLAVCLVLIAALLVTTAPVQASPGGKHASNSPLTDLVAWFHGLVLDLGLVSADGGGEPEPLFLPESVCIDPNGVQVPCPKLTGPARIPTPDKTGEAGSAPRMR